MMTARRMSLGPLVLVQLAASATCQVGQITHTCSSGVCTLHHLSACFYSMCKEVVCTYLFRAVTCVAITRL